MRLRRAISSRWSPAGANATRHRAMQWTATDELQATSRHVGTIEPLWNLFDLIPEGRGTDWYEQLSYW